MIYHVMIECRVLLEKALHRAATTTDGTGTIRHAPERF
jgi:hypothetical protein